MNPETAVPSRLQTIAFYILLASIVLVPLAFWPSQYFALESVKTVVIGVLTMTSFIVLAISAAKNKEVRLPPKSMLILGILMLLSMIASSVSSGHFIKSFFGQGFEIGAASFILTLALASLVTFSIVVRSTGRVVIIYAGVVTSFLILWIFQALRLVIGPNFASLGILSTTTSTVLGSWFSLGIFAVVVDIICLLAITFLPLSQKMKIAYSALLAIGALTIFVVNSSLVWSVATFIFLGLSIYLSLEKPRPEGPALKSLLKRLSWLPLVAFLVSLFFAWNGTKLVGPLVDKMSASYTELSLPWRLTLDVAAGELKDRPILGAGSNRFSQAYLTYKPTSINTTDAWGVEFSNGFALVPTFLVTQGLLGGMIWVLFFIYFGILGVRSLRGLRDTDGYTRFVVTSAYTAAAFIWLMSLAYVPSHALLFLAFIMTGIWLGASVAYGRLSSVTYRVVPVFAWVLALLALLGAFTYAKNAAALGYFGSGVKALTTTTNPNPALADRDFTTAISLNPLDIYWQGRAEAGIALTKSMLSAITATTSALESQAIASSSVQVVSQSLEYAKKAITADKDNYNNYVSLARVGEIATAMRMPDGYQIAVDAYTNAIKLNPQNPSIYLSLARLEAGANQLDPAIQAVGAALQVKSNYLDAVYLLSQLEAAKGNLADAIIAAQFATQLNANNPLLFFQLGLLEYTNGDYAPAEKAFAQAVTLEPSYANAIYFLGLSFARLGDTADAITLFEKLGASNPDNQDLRNILSTLHSGRSLFAAPGTAAAIRAEKRSGPPIPVK